MWCGRFCTVLGLTVLLGLFAGSEYLCSMWINISLGIVTGFVGGYLIKHENFSGWILIAASGLLFLSNYPPLLKCESCCYVNRFVFGLLLTAGGMLNIFRKDKIKTLRSR